MANEATVHSNLTIFKQSGTITVLDYQGRPTAFTATVSGKVGPTPGAFTVGRTGTDVDLSELTSPGGLCKMTNRDDTNYVTYGIWDGSSFYPLGEILPGESYVLRLARNLGEEYGAGTGTTGAGINTLRFKSMADVGDDDIVVSVEAFDK